jgi:hypothetical protein
MRYLLVVFLLFGLVACKTTGVVVDVDTNVGYLNYTEIAQKWMSENKVEKMTDEQVLGLITGIKRNMEAKGWVVIGVEGAQNRIWFERPVSGE